MAVRLLLCALIDFFLIIFLQRRMSLVDNSAVVDIDRTSITPVLIRCFWKLHRHHISSDYRGVGRNVFPNQEVLIHTWPDATLRDILELLKDTVDYVRDSDTVLEFSLVYLDRTANWSLKNVSHMLYLTAV
ncbi:hypothetical protein EON63_09395 [archaeon]|nr:MAG: hypothetical protein EON63_09395 [archaeon]